MADAEAYSEVFVEIVEYSHRSGVTRINRLPGCWEFAAGDWWLAVNGHDVPTRCSRGFAVPPFQAYVEFCGLPAGLVSPRGGVLAAGACANEAALLAALRALPGKEAANV